jgi:hypothetical protein
MPDSAGTIGAVALHETAVNRRAKLLVDLATLAWCTGEL